MLYHYCQEDSLSSRVPPATEGLTGTPDSTVAQVKQVYIGETCQPVWNRIQEHMKKVANMSPDSFIVQHWCLKHGTET